MRDARRRTPKRIVRHLDGRRRLLPELGRPSSLLEWETPEGWLLTRRARAVLRGVGILLWVLPSIVLQAGFLLLPGRLKVRFARKFWSVFSHLLGVKVRVIGQLASGQQHPVIFVSNHSSWVDIPVLGGVLDGCFVAKGEVSRWPVISLIARLGRSVFVTRQRNTMRQERDMMRGRLASRDNLILFPEGTSSDGSRVLPFRSAFFAVADPADDGVAPIIQPVSLVYDRLGGLPAGRATRPVFAWYGDMDIASHFWRLAQNTGLRATVLLHAPLDPARFPDRKRLSHAVWQTIADGAAALRQNRPAKPLTVAEPSEPEIVGGEPALA